MGQVIRKTEHISHKLKEKIISVPKYKDQLTMIMNTIVRLKGDFEANVMKALATKQLGFHPKFTYDDIGYVQDNKSVSKVAWVVRGLTIGKSWFGGVTTKNKTLFLLDIYYSGGQWHIDYEIENTPYWEAIEKYMDDHIIHNVHRLLNDPGAVDVDKRTPRGRERKNM